MYYIINILDTISALHYDWYVQFYTHYETTTAL